MNIGRRKLIDEAMGLLGMIDEIKSKSQLYKSKIQEDEELGFEKSFSGLVVDVEVSMSQMRNELATYSRRLDEIHEELRSYVVISDISGKSPKPRLHV